MYHTSFPILPQVQQKSKSLVLSKFTFWNAFYSTDVQLVAELSLQKSGGELGADWEGEVGDLSTKHRGGKGTERGEGGR